jgi:hypothetical protein
MLHAYFDESGKFQDSNFICLTGYIASDGQWEAFCKEWVGLLQKHDIPYIHMKNFIALQGEYKKKGWSHADRDKILEEFINVIRRNVLAGFGIGLDAQYYRSLDQESKKRLGRDPGLFCFERLIRRIVDKLIKSGHEPSISMVFDDDQHYAMNCYARWCKLKKRNPGLGNRISTMCFADDKVFQPLQGADILAHETNKYLRVQLEGRKVRSHFLNLLKSHEPPYGIEYVSELWDKNELGKLICELQNKDLFLE